MLTFKQPNPAQAESAGQLFTILEIAELIGVSRMTVRRWIDAGDLSRHRLGRLVRISQRDLDRFLASRREANPTNWLQADSHKGP